MGIFKRLFGFKKTDKKGPVEEQNPLLNDINEVDFSDLVFGSTFAGKTGKLHTKSREQIIQEINKDVYQCEQQSESYSERRKQSDKPGKSVSKITTLPPTHDNSSSLNSHSTGSHFKDCSSSYGSSESGSSDSGGSCD